MSMTFFQWATAAQVSSGVIDEDRASEIFELWKEYEYKYDKLLREKMDGITHENFLKEVVGMNILVWQPGEERCLSVIAVVGSQHYRCDYYGHDGSWGWENSDFPYDMWEDAVKVTPVQKMVTVFE